MGSDQYTVPDDCSCRTYFCCFLLALANTFPCPFVPILSNFFEKRRTQNHPQCLSGLSRALFPTTFLEIAIYTIQRNTFQFQRMLQFWFPENICREFKLNQLESRTTGTTCVLGLLLMNNCCIQLFAGATIIQNSLSNRDSLRREVKIYLFQTYHLVKLLKGDHVTCVFAGLHSFCFFFWRSTKIWLSMHPRHFGSHVTVVRPPARQGNQIECTMAFFQPANYVSLDDGGQCYGQLTADQCNTTVSQAQLSSQVRSRVFVRFSADQLLAFN